MKKFLFKLVIYASLLFSVTMTVNLIYIHKTSSNDETKKMLNVPYGIQICNIGSSHGVYAFNYEDAEKNYVCFNFALLSQVLLYDYRIMTYYRDRLQKGTVVFIPVSYFSFFGVPEEQTFDFASRNRKYYKFLPENLILKYDRKTDLYVNYFPSLVTNDLFQLLSVLFKDQHSEERVLKAEGIAKEAHRLYELHVASGRDKDGARIYNRENIEALYRVIDLCREAGALPILITTPFFCAYNEAVRENDPKFFDDFYGVIKKIVKDTGIKYCDYSHDKRYTYDSSMFFDSNHMSMKGGRIFTDSLLHEVLSIDVNAGHCK